VDENSAATMPSSAADFGVLQTIAWASRGAATTIAIPAAARFHSQGGRETISSATAATAKLTASADVPCVIDQHREVAPKRRITESKATVGEKACRSRSWTAASPTAPAAYERRGGEAP